MCKVVTNPMFSPLLDGHVFSDVMYKYFSDGWFFRIPPRVLALLKYWAHTYTSLLY